MLRSKYLHALWLGMLAFGHAVVRNVVETIELAASHVDDEVVASVHLDAAPNREQTWGHSHTLVHSLEHDFLENFGFTSLLNPYEPGPYVNLEAYLHVETEEEVDHC
jgi:hypothetical protein